MSFLPTEPLGLLQDSYPFIAPGRYAGQLKGKVALITGVSGGIGPAIAKAFAAAGASVAAVARRKPQLKALVDEIKASGGHAIYVVGDVAEREAPKNVIAKVEKELGPIDILVNNAGIMRVGVLELEDENVDLWWRVHEVNVRAPVAMIRAVLPGMIQRKSGYLITTASDSATKDFPTISAYSSSKAAISKFHEGITYELRDTGITNFAVHPGTIPSDLISTSTAINSASMNHPAVKEAFRQAQIGYDEPQTAEIAADTMVALVANPDAKILSGYHINAPQDLEVVLKEAQKAGNGKIGKEGLYKVRIGQL